MKYKETQRSGSSGKKSVDSKKESTPTEEYDTEKETAYANTASFESQKSAKKNEEGGIKFLRAKRYKKKK